MGVDCKVTLPAGVRVLDVADAVGIAAGCEWHWKLLPQNGTRYVSVPGVTVSATPVVGLAEIHMKGELADGESDHSMAYHFEFAERGAPGFLVRSTSFWIAVSRRVVDCFGGIVDYNDCDANSCDYVVAPTRGWDAEGNASFDHKQQRLADVTAVGAWDLEQAAGAATYDD